jgi:hypothetical protein
MTSVPPQRPSRAAEPARYADVEPAEDLGDLVVRVTRTGDDAAERRRVLASLGQALAASARRAGGRAVGGGRWLADVVAEIAPRIPIRDRATLRAHHPGRSDEEIADALVRGATVATAGMGAAAGAVATVEFAAPPTLLAMPFLLAAEAVAIAAVEIKLVAELHELHGRAVPGSLTERGSTYLMSWVRQRAVEPAIAGTGLATVVGYAAKRELRARMLRRLGRNTFALAPFLAGAVAGAEVNRRATRALAAKVRADLRTRRR